MQCPQCDSTLNTIDYEGIAIETCAQCGGEWLDAKELGKINQIRETRFDPQEKRIIAESTTITGVPLQDVDRDLPCPKCAGQTDAVNFGGDTGIIIDRCTDCGGIWLDACEMERIQMIAEHWGDQLDEDQKQYASRLRQVAADVDARDNVNYSRFGVVNLVVNGILDWRGT